MAGAYDLAIACGVENMSTVGLGTNSIQPGFAFSDAWFEAVGGHDNLYTQFMAAQEIARRWNISREHMDEFGLESHRRAWQAAQEGRVQRDIRPFTVTRPGGQGPKRTTHHATPPHTPPQ